MRIFFNYCFCQMSHALITVSSHDGLSTAFIVGHGNLTHVNNCNCSYRIMIAVRIIWKAGFYSKLLKLHSYIQLRQFSTLRNTINITTVLTLLDTC